MEYVANLVKRNDVLRLNPPLSTIFVTLFFDLIMIITGLIGALVPSTYKWGYFTMGCVAMLYVFWVTFVPGLKSATRLGPEFKRISITSAAMLSFLWFLYPICWACAEGSNLVSPTGEFVFYGVLDLLAKPVFALYHIYSLRNCDYSLAFRSGKLEAITPSSAITPMDTLTVSLLL